MAGHLSAPAAKLVVVGSKNPVKLTAVKEAFETVFPDDKFSFESIDVPSGVSECVTSFHNHHVPLPAPAALLVPRMPRSVCALPACGDSLSLLRTTVSHRRTLCHLAERLWAMCAARIGTTLVHPNGCAQACATE